MIAVRTDDGLLVDLVRGFRPGTAVDAAGNVLLTDSASHVIRVVAKTTGTYYGRPMTAGDIYTIAGGGTQNPDGVPALQAALSNLVRPAVDSAGNVLIADSIPGSGALRVLAEQNGTYYGRDMIAGDIYTLATMQIIGVRPDHNGNLLLAVRDNSTTHGWVEVLAVKTGNFYGQAMTAGQTYKIAGSQSTTGTAQTGVPALGAIVNPADVVADWAGNLVIPDNGYHIVRVIAVKTATYYGQAMQSGHIYTIAGTGATGLSGNNGPALSARLYLPSQVAVDNSGNLIIGDSGVCQLRVIAAHTGTYYDRAMTAEDIYQLAGTGKCSFAGDGGPASNAWTDSVNSVTWTPSGILISNYNRVRLITAA